MLLKGREKGELKLKQYTPKIKKKKNLKEKIIISFRSSIQTLNPEKEFLFFKKKKKKSYIFLEERFVVYELFFF